MPTYMSAVPRSTVPSLVGGESQRLLVGAQRLAQATLGDPDVRQRDRAAEDVSDVPGPPQPLGSDRVGPVRGLEVAASPAREPREGRCPGSGEVVLFSRTVDRPLGVVDGGGSVASNQGQGGPVHLDHRGKALELALVDDHHPLRRGPRAVTVLWAAATARPPAAAPRRPRTPRRHQRPDVAHREHRPDPDHVVGDGLEPAPDRGLLPAPGASPGSPARPDPRLARRRRRPARGGSPPMAPRSARTTRWLAVSAAGTSPVGLLVQEMGLQDVREQVVVAVPPAAVVQRDHEQVGAVQRLPAWPCRRAGR